MIALMSHHEIITYAKNAVYIYQSDLTKEMISGLEVCDDYINHKIGVSEARKMAFLMHRYAREENELLIKYLYRACGHARACIHVKEHLIPCMTYLVKVKRIKGGQSHD
jgi:hypothetical protein